MVAVTGMCVQTSLRLSGVSHRETDGQTDGQNKLHSRVIRLDKHWPHSVVFFLGGSDCTKALGNSLCTAVSMYGGYSC